MENKNVKNNAAENDIATVPYYAFEAEQARSERRDRRYIVAFIIAIALIFISNMAWLFVWCQYDYADTSTVTLDSGEGGNANYIGNDGDINNGKDYSNKNTVEDENPQN